MSDGAPAAPAPYPARLSVGFPYLPSFPVEFYACSDAGLDFVELTPEVLCRERREGTTRRLELVEPALQRAQRACGDLPIVVHGVELSIGSAHAWNEAYVAMLDDLRVRWPFRWHSEHLGFQTVPDGSGGSRETGVPLPLPFTTEAADLVAARARLLRERFACPFLLEPPAHYFRCLGNPVEEEPWFLRRVLETSGCGLLLDLHNLYCNAINYGVDPATYLAALPLAYTVEIHIAGGAWKDGYLMDSHSERVPPAVWDLLHQALASAPQVSGVVYEILEETSAHLTPEAAARELEIARACWRAAQHRTAA